MLAFNLGLRDGQKPLIGLRQQSREQRGPPELTGFVPDEILANFDSDVMQAALLAMNGDRVV